MRFRYASGYLRALTSLVYRLERLVDQPQIFFHALYNRLPPQSTSSEKRTFIVLPPSSSPVAESFEPIDCPGDTDEVGAHMAMFESKSKPYFNMGLREFIERTRSAKLEF